MSPSGSRMHTAGTSTVVRPFCRRASRSRAAGWNTEEAVVSFLSHIVGIQRLNSMGARRQRHSDKAVSRPDRRTRRRAQSCFSRFWVADESGRPCDSCCRHVLPLCRLCHFRCERESSVYTISVALGCKLIRRAMNSGPTASLAGKEFDRTRSALACV
jgi:hypothetical protein